MSRALPSVLLALHYNDMIEPIIGILYLALIVILACALIGTQEAMKSTSRDVSRLKDEVRALWRSQMFLQDFVTKTKLETNNRFRDLEKYLDIEMTQTEAKASETVYKKRKK